MAVKVLALVGVAALTFFTIRGIRRGVRAIRAKRSGEAADTPGTTELAAEQTAAAGAAEGLELIVGAEVAEVSDADDALVDEVRALCEESSATMKACRVRHAATGEDCADDAPRQARAQKQRRTRE